ncbi:MAG: norG, partial [Microbacterium sp.]|nr:norG [Microbacterium sp.]
FAVELGTPEWEQLIGRMLIPRLPEIIAQRAHVLREGRDAAVRSIRERLPEWEVPTVDGGLSLWVDLGAPLSGALVMGVRSEGVLLSAAQALRRTAIASSRLQKSPTGRKARVLQRYRSARKRVPRPDSYSSTSPAGAPSRSSTRQRPQPSRINVCSGRRRTAEAVPVGAVRAAVM